MSITQVMSEILMFFKVVKGLKTLKKHEYFTHNLGYRHRTESLQYSKESSLQWQFFIRKYPKSKSYSKDHKNTIEVGRVVPKKQKLKHIPVLSNNTCIFGS